MSEYSGRRCPFLCCKLGVTQKPLSPYRTHNVQPFGRNDDGEKVRFCLLYFFPSFDVRSMRITIRSVLICDKAPIAINRCTEWFKIFVKNVKLRGDDHKHMRERVKSSAGARSSIWEALWLF